MPKKIYIVDLTTEERTELLELIKSGKQSGRKLNRARILLLADEGKTDKSIAATLHTGTATVQRARQRFVEDNLAGALNERPRPGGQKSLDEKGEAVLESLAHSKPPEGRKRWTLELLAARLVQLKVVNSISYETVRQELKKNGLSLG
jgi:transposase